MENEAEVHLNHELSNNIVNDTDVNEEQLLLV